MEELIEPLDPDRGTVVLTPRGTGKGEWVGCPTVLYEPEAQRFWLTYRHRRRRGDVPDRGWRCGVAMSVDGLHFEEVWAVEKNELGTPSMERFCLARDPIADGYVLYLSYVDPEDNRWRVDVIAGAAPCAFDVRARRPVLTADSTRTEGVKDPFVVRIGRTVHLFASYACKGGLGENDRARAHAEGDIYNTGVTTHPTGRAASVDGRSFQWQGQTIAVGRTWDRYQARLSSVVSCERGFLGFYDGSADASENYEERAGLAVSRDLRAWRRITTEAPILTSPHGTGSLRYCSVVPVDNELVLYYECARPDGSHDLRVSRARLSAFAELVDR